jgi:hypothetical protein
MGLQEGELTRVVKMGFEHAFSGLADWVLFLRRQSPQKKDPPSKNEAAPTTDLVDRTATLVAFFCSCAGWETLQQWKQTQML